MKKFILVILLIVATILPTFATNWVQVGEKSWMDVDTIEPFVDDYGNTVPNQYSFWIKRLNNGSFKDTEKLYNKKIWYMLSKDVIDIKRKSSASKCFILYDLKGNPVDSLENSVVLMEWTSIIPNTVGELQYEIIRDYAQARRY